MAKDGIIQVQENGPEWQRLNAYYYKIIIPHKLFPTGLFVELVLIDDDPESPSVWIVNARAQSS